MSNTMATRVAYGRALEEFGANERVVALEADLAICTMSELFARKYHERFINLGIAECNMIGAAAGIAATGKIPFCHSFAGFSAGRGYDQIRNSCAYPHLNVKIIGSHAGLTVGEDGATHQCIEDLSIMRTIPGMVVLSTADYTETREAVRAMIEYDGPCYLRTSRYETRDVTGGHPGYRFELGKGVILSEGNDVTIMATGTMVQEAVDAGEMLRREGVFARVIDIHTIKPIDRELVVDSARKTGVIVTVEEHNIIGGLGSAVSEVVTDCCPIRVVRMGVKDTFGRSGPAGELLKLYGLTAEHIASEAAAAARAKE